jgi:NadR type nicotinamide-nucleotide adenylyltransferase
MPTRAPRRIVVTGPECTGKTTLAAELARSLGAPLIPEAARLFAEEHRGGLSAETVGPIAELAIRLEEDAIAASGAPAPLLVRDTDLVSTVVYARHYYGSAPPWIESEALRRRADLYLLCVPDLPWVADGIRDRPRHREELYADFERELARIGATVAVIRGSGAARSMAASAAVRAAGFSVPASASD